MAKDTTSLYRFKNFVGRVLEVDGAWLTVMPDDNSKWWMNGWYTLKYPDGSDIAVRVVRTSHRGDCVKFRVESKEES